MKGKLDPDGIFVARHIECGNVAHPAHRYIAIFVLVLTAFATWLLMVGLLVFGLLLVLGAACKCRQQSKY